MTIVVTSDDDPQFMRLALASHQPRYHITVHPTPRGGDAVHLAHDLIRSLGKHLPLLDDQNSGMSVFSGTYASWRIAAAWCLALSIDRLTVCRAHLLRLPNWQHLLAFSARTGTHLTLLCNGPIPREVLLLLNAVEHRILDTSGAAAEHWRTTAGLEEMEGHPWWQHQAVFPPLDDEPWFLPPPQPRRRLTARHRFQQAPAARRPQEPAVEHGHCDITVVADRIHTRIAHPVFAACVAIHALTGHRPHQIPAFYEDASIRFPFIPPWAALLVDAARCLQDVGGPPGISSSFLSATQEDSDISKALLDCRLVTT
ncbi:hypothetical protein [Streptomyces sp. NPDC005302]|uniref:hypothetical protein n=1 Tax=Streptomyces sp. NPDC005302 TaxID=3154675 RepID=UPI0033A61989